MSDLPAPPVCAIGQPGPEFQIDLHGGKLTNSQLKGRWVVIECLPRGEVRCRTITALLHLQEHFSRRQIVMAALVDEPAGAAGLVRATADHHGEPGFLGMIADPELLVAAGLGVVDAVGALQAASVVIDPEGILCGLVRHDPEGGRDLDNLLVMIDALRAGRAGCASQRPVAHV